MAHSIESPANQPEWKRRTLAALCAIAMVASPGCESSTAKNSSPTDTAGRNDQAHSPLAPESTAPQPSEKPIVRVETPWKEGEFQKGVQLYWHHNAQPFDAEATTELAARQLDYIVGLGANSVGISFPLYVDGATPTTAYADLVETPSPEELDIVLGAAKERGLRVVVRPLIDEANIAAEKKGAWRGSIQPENIDEWFVQYSDLLVQYAPHLIAHDVDEYVVGVELFSLQDETEQWQRVQHNIRAAGYTGQLSYALNWDQSADQVPFETLGVDLYPAVDLPDSASTAELTSALSSWLNRQSSEVRRKMTVQEVGIAALSGVYAHPWQWGTGTRTDTLNLAVQEKWFAAACTAAKDTETNGTYYWMLDKYEDPTVVNAAAQLPKSFVGRPAEDAIRDCFRETAE